MAVHPQARIHPDARVDDPCTIGSGTSVWHFSHVRSGAIIGEGCNIGQNAYVGAGVRIGNRCKIQNNVSVYESVTLEDEVFCGPSMVFTNVVNPRAFIERKDEFRPTLVRRGATIGANATILCGITIGRYAMIGAGATVTRDVPDFALILGVPGRVAGWVSRAGHRLEFEDGQGCCPESGERYQLSGNRVVLLD
ncbi:MAG: acyltransferase [Sumerlaeia bacterium]